jgi:hypothetical protein
MLPARPLVQRSNGLAIPIDSCSLSHPSVTRVLSAIKRGLQILLREAKAYVSLAPEPPLFENSISVLAIYNTRVVVIYNAIKHCRVTK